MVLPVVFFMHQGDYRTAFYLFLFTSVTDALDGFLARRFGWVSRFGSIADPLADKAMVLSVLWMLAWQALLPFSVFYWVLLRDGWIIVGALAYHYWIGAYLMCPSFLGKFTTFFQFVFLSLALAFLAFQNIPKVLIEVGALFLEIMMLITMVHYTLVWGWKAYTSKEQNNGR